MSTISSNVRHPPLQKGDLIEFDYWFPIDKPKVQRTGFEPKRIYAVVLRDEYRHFWKSEKIKFLYDGEIYDMTIHPDHNIEIISL